MTVSRGYSLVEVGMGWSLLEPEFERSRGGSYIHIAIADCLETARPSRRVNACHWLRWKHGGKRDRLCHPFVCQKRYSKNDNSPRHPTLPSKM